MSWWLQRNQMGTVPSGIPQNLPPSPGMLARAPALWDPSRNPMGAFQGFGKLFRQGLGGMGADPTQMPGAGSFGDLNPMEKAFLISSGIGAAADIGTGIYDRLQERRKEQEEKEMREMAGRRLNSALTGSHSRAGYHGRM